MGRVTEARDEAAFHRERATKHRASADGILEDAKTEDQIADDLERFASFLEANGWSETSA